MAAVLIAGIVAAVLIARDVSTPANCNATAAASAKARRSSTVRAPTASRSSRSCAHSKKLSPPIACRASLNPTVTSKPPPPSSPARRLRSKLSCRSCRAKAASANRSRRPYDISGPSRSKEVGLISGAPVLAKLPVESEWLEYAEQGRIKDIDDPRADALADALLEQLEPHFEAQRKISLL